MCGQQQAVPLAASMVASVAMNGRMLSRVMISAVEQADASPARDAAEQAGQPAVGAEAGGDDARQGGDRADREVDAAGHDDEAMPSAISANIEL